MAKDIPEFITAAHIRKAIQLLKNGQGKHNFGKAKLYEVVYKGERYAPKAVIGTAWQIADGREVGPYDFYSGTTPKKAVGFLRKRGFKVAPKRQNDTYDAYLFTFKAEDWEEFDEFLGIWSENHGEIVQWSSGKSKSIPAGVPIFLMKQGRDPTGIIASGFTASKNYPDERWNKRKQKRVPGRWNDLRFTRFLDPIRDKLLNIDDLPKQYWASRASGIGLPPEILRDISARWKHLLGDNTSEREEAHRAPTLSEHDADDDYEIDNKDTRKTAIRQIKERRGQRTFREKMLASYGGRCSISGCQVIDVLEAAHIRSYIGENDHNPQNGLLLRADLHTLFDLLLFGIHPDKKAVQLHPSLDGSEYEKLKGKRLRKAKILPSYEALRWRWRQFEEKLNKSDA